MTIVLLADTKVFVYAELTGKKTKQAIYIKTPPRHLRETYLLCRTQEQLQWKLL